MLFRSAPPSQVTLLVVTGYLIATLVCQMPAGSIADRAGHMRALTWGRWNLHGAPCLDTLQLASLHLLAEQCERVWGPRLDIEWAVDHAGVLHLLQCRPITV